MRDKILLMVSLAVLAALTIPATCAAAISVDGNLDDWGLSALSGPVSDWSVNGTWIPTNQAVEFVVANNDNPLHSAYPGYYTSGVHITGNKNNWKFYDEPLGILKATGKEVNVPWGGEPYDVEAMYLLQDQQNIYLAVVTSMPQDGLMGEHSGHDDTPSDLAMHFSNVNGAKYNFEYGVKLGSQKSIGNYNPGDIVFLPDWQDFGYILPARPDVMKSPALSGGSVVGQAQIAYTSSWINHVDEGSPQYVIELSIPKAVVGLGQTETAETTSSSGNVGLSNFHITQNCQNDSLYVPEFPTMAVSVGAILGLVFVVYSLRQNKK